MNKKQRKLIGLFKEFLHQFEWIQSASFKIDFRYTRLTLTSLNGASCEGIENSRITNLWGTSSDKPDSEIMKSFFVNSGMKISEFNDFCQKKTQFLQSHQMSFYPKCGISPIVEYKR